MNIFYISILNYNFPRLSFQNSAQNFLQNDTHIGFDGKTFSRVLRNIIASLEHFKSILEKNGCIRCIPKKGLFLRAQESHP